MVRTDLGRIYETRKGLFVNAYTVRKGRKGKKTHTWRVRLSKK
jgi:hypothetical protein